MEKKRSLLVDALGQILIKPRGLLKMSQIWLPLSVILATGNPMNQSGQLPSSLYLIFAVLCKGLSSILINDLTDREIDRRAGKERWITSLPLAGGILIPVSLLASGFFALIKAGGDISVFLSFTATAVLGVLYSLRPIRFKERGIWGVLAYALSAAILNTLVPWTLLRPTIVLLPLLFSAVVGEKLVQILFHQIIDFDSDSEAKIKSFAVIAGQDKANRALRSLIKIGLVADAAVLFYILFETKEQPLFFWAVALASFLGIAAAGIYARIISKRYQATTKLTEMLPWPSLGLSYVLFYMLPPLLFLMLALPKPEMWALVMLSGLSLLGASINFVSYNPKK